MKVIFVASLSHSGSTLLDLMLNAHPKVASVGELKQLNRFACFKNNKRLSCTCGKPSLWECEFWSSVNTATTRTAGKTIGQLNVEDYDNVETFQRDNIVLFRAIAETSGKEFIVDSSKSRMRLKLLLENPEIDVLPVLLLRNPKGQICSTMGKVKNKDVGLSRLIQSYVATNRRVYAMIKDHPHFVLEYERLINSPEQSLDGLMGQIGLSFDWNQLNWAACERHNVGGNRMRRGTSSKLVSDDKWRRNLTLAQKLMIDVGTLPGRYPLLMWRRWSWTKERRVKGKLRRRNMGLKLDGVGSGSRRPIDKGVHHT